MAVTGGAVPLFILSFRHRDELKGTAERAGWQPIAARRADNAESRFIASGAQVAIVDARGALAEGREAVRMLADPVEAIAAALLVLLSRTDEESLDDLFAAGATHFLVSPFSEQQLLQAVQFAGRHARRVGGRRPLRRQEVGHSWRWQPGSGTVELSPALARKAGLGEEAGQRLSLMELFRKLDPAGRRAARGAIDRLMATGEATAFAHSDVESEGRLALHLRVEGGRGGIVGRTESIASVQDEESRDAMTGVRDAAAMRAWIGRLLEAGESVLLLLLAVSRFDTINAAFGRGIGDSVLQAAARRIERAAEADGRKRLVARMAGAEFAIGLAMPATLPEARFLAGQLVESLGRPFLSGDHVISLGSRVGVVSAVEGDDVSALLRRASAALAEAKTGESGPVRVFDEADQGGGSLADQLDVDLRRALDRGEIEIVFQPQVRLASRQIIGVEALAR